MRIELGDLAPDVELANHLGEQVRLADLWSERPLLLVFLRHLGCPLCFDHVARIRQEYLRFQAKGIGIAAMTMGDASQALKFKESQRLPCDVLADPQLVAYKAYGLEKGGVMRIAGPRMWWAGFKSVVKFGAARPVGDIWQMPGAFLIDRGGKVLYAHRAAHSGDLESYDNLLEVFDRSREQLVAAGTK